MWQCQLICLCVDGLGHRHIFASKVRAGRLTGAFPPLMISDYRTPDEIQIAMGAKLRARRISLGLQQTQAADRAGVSVRAWRDLERGAGSSLDTFVRAARVLGFSERLDALIAPPVPTVSPMAMLAAQKRPAQRVRERKPLT